MDRDLIVIWAGVVLVVAIIGGLWGYSLQQDRVLALNMAKAGYVEQMVGALPVWVRVQNPPCLPAQQ